MVLEAERRETVPTTYYASPELADPLAVHRLSGRILSNRNVMDVLEAVPGIAVILNAQRQIVACNRRTLAELGVDDFSKIIGKRLGEALGCIQVSETPSGCGTGEACALCGAGTAVTESQAENSGVTRECRISLECEGFGAREFEVVATPLFLENETLTVCSLRDVSSEKRRQVLERVFFHDVMNTAGGIRGIAAVLAEEGFEVDDDGELRTMMVGLAEDLVDEILHQRQILAAERGELEVDRKETNLQLVVKEVAALLKTHQVGRGRKITLQPPGSEITTVTDPVLLRRIVINMVKNALEAVSPESEVRIALEESDEEVSILVNNPGVMADEVRLQIFNRSFSTKEGTGRGLGTYSMKLLGEEYLGGRVEFSSEDPDGTTFRLTLPKVTS